MISVNSLSVESSTEFFSMCIKNVVYKTSSHQTLIHIGHGLNPCPWWARILVKCWRPAVYHDPRWSAISHSAGQNPPLFTTSMRLEVFTAHLSSYISLSLFLISFHVYISHNHCIRISKDFVYHTPPPSLDTPVLCIVNPNRPTLMSQWGSQCPMLPQLGAVSENLAFGSRA